MMVRVCKGKAINDDDKRSILANGIMTPIMMLRAVALHRNPGQFQVGLYKYC